MEEQDPGTEAEQRLEYLLDRIAETGHEIEGRPQFSKSGKPFVHAVIGGADHFVQIVEGRVVAGREVDGQPEIGWLDGPPPDDPDAVTFAKERLVVRFDDERAEAE